MKEKQLVEGVDFMPSESMRNAVLRCAYMRGFRDAENGNRGEDKAAPLSPGAMLFGFFCWTAMLFFVFR